MSVFDDLPVVDDQHPFERERLLDVMGNADQRLMAPDVAGTRQEIVPSRSIQAAERLVENRQAHGTPDQRAPEADALSFSS